MKPLTYDRGYDNVLLAQGYRTPRGAVIDEYGAGGIMISRGKLKNSEKNLLQSHFVYHESYFVIWDRTRVSAVRSQRNVSPLQLRHGVETFRTTILYFYLVKKFAVTATIVWGEGHRWVRNLRPAKISLEPTC
jgi:hypothetical protein